MPNVLIYLLALAAYIGLAIHFRPGSPACSRPTIPNRLLLFVPLLMHAYLLGLVIFPEGGLSMGFGSSVSAMAALTVFFYGIAMWYYPLASMQSLVLLFAALGLARLRVRTLAANQAALRFYRALGYAPYELTLERELPHARPRRAARKFARRGTRARGRG